MSIKLLLHMGIGHYLKNDLKKNGLNSRTQVMKNRQQKVKCTTS